MEMNLLVAKDIIALEESGEEEVEEYFLKIIIELRGIGLFLYT